MAKLKKGLYGMTHMRSEVILGTAIVYSNRFNNIKGEIINVRDDHLKYLTVQVPSEYKDRVYILNLQYSQCKDIVWRDNDYI